MSRAFTLAGAAALGVLTFVNPLSAQSSWTVSFGLGAGREVLQSRLGSAQTRLTGSLVGGEAVATRHHLVARLRYGQGQVTGDTTARDVVEGEALLGYTARPWLDLWLGPRARTFSASGLSDRRWLLWSAGVRARGEIFPGRVESFVELWQGFSGTLNRPAAAASGGGVEVGLEARLPRHPWWARLGYRLEQGRVDSGRRDTSEEITFTIGYVPLR